MQYKRVCILLLILSLVLGTLCGCSNSGRGTAPETTGNPNSGSAEPTATYDDAELARAVELGIGQYKAVDDPITYGEFTEMLDAVIRLSGEDVFAEWEPVLKNARNSAETMTRREGMVAVYLAAEALGPEYYRYNNIADGTQIFDEIASVDEWLFWDEMWSADYSLFPNVEDIPQNGEGSYVNAGYFYSMNRASLLNGQTIFDYDTLD